MHARRPRLLVLLVLLFSTFVRPAAPSQALVATPPRASGPVSNTLGGATYTPTYPLPDTPPNYAPWEGDHTSPRNEAAIVNFNSLEDLSYHKTLSHVVTDADGTMHAVFYRRPGTYGELYYSTSPAIDTGDQAAAVRIDTVAHPQSSNQQANIPVDIPDQDGQYARVAVDADGYVHVVWVVDSQIWYRSCGSNCHLISNWNAAYRLEQFEFPPPPSPTDPLCQFYHPTIVAWKEGGAHHAAIAVERTGVDKNHIVFLRTTGTNTWPYDVNGIKTRDSVVKLSSNGALPTPQLHRTPILAISAPEPPPNTDNHTMHVIWHQHGDQNNDGIPDSNGL